jgi:hypothetical protein
MNRSRLKMIVLGMWLLLLVGVTAVVAASGGQMTSGEFHTFAVGPERGYDISGQAVMVRTGNGRTQVHVQAQGLTANTTYPVHVHNAPCTVNNGGGHYQQVPGGPVDNVNEIWPGFTTNANGQGKGHASNDFTARPEAQAVVIHDTDGARIACADLN